MVPHLQRDSAWDCAVVLFISPLACKEMRKEEQRDEGQRGYCAFISAPQYIFPNVIYMTGACKRLADSKSSAAGRIFREVEQRQGWCFRLFLQHSGIYSPWFLIRASSPAHHSPIYSLSCTVSEIKTYRSIRGGVFIRCAEMGTGSETCTVTQRTFRDCNYLLDDTI